MRLAYPGVWLREDVYAIHGHYADLHATVPTFERLAAGAMARWAVTLPEQGATPDDYEAVLAPLYAWIHALTQRADRAVVSAGAGASSRAWVALGGRGRRRPPSARPRCGAGLRGGGGRPQRPRGRAGRPRPLGRRRCGAAACAASREVLRRLGVGAPHVVWGHSHRSGPWPGDDAAEWATAAGGRILNTGSWVYQPHFLTPQPNASPYWPGTAVRLEDGGPPRLVRLLGDLGHAELRPPA